ncbi:RNA polymerase sigma factor [Rhizobium sp. CF080]|uniref:RNA polymerase sigma factor n=1 Tax=Rhizobium sp. (strain CF080) TaxID=1144310 RepID=UPI0018CC608B|nr:RNA polymerase sigma factor [Rhizobium sp. CF080]
MNKLGIGKLLSAFLQVRPRLEATATKWTGNRAIAEDLLQDTWLKLESRSGERSIENPAGFVAQVAKNTISDHARKERRRAEIDSDVADLLWEATDEISPERTTIGKENLKAVSAALDELPERTRRIFLLNRIDQISHRRIAEMFGITDEAVYYHIRRALEHLADIRDQMSR